MSPEQIVEQFQQVVGTLKRIVEASGNLEGRVVGLERNWGDTLGALTAIQGNVQLLLETYQSHTIEQNQLNERLESRIADLEARFAALDGGRAPLV